MDEQELKDMIKGLQEQGWEPMACDSPILSYDNGVACGIPKGVGDIVPPETFLLPRALLNGDMVFAIRAQGDSMTGVDIDDGDGLIVRVSNVPKDGDIVLAYIDEEYSVKTFCEDENGQPWLIPQNDNYKAFPFVGDGRTQILGIVTQVIKNSARTTYRDCMKKIRMAKAELEVKHDLSPAKLSSVIHTVASMITVGRMWYAVCRPMMDHNVVPENDYDGFCRMIAEEVPRHEHLPKVVEMQRMATLSFAKPVKQWRENNAPVGGKRFTAYYNMAKLTDKLLEAD